MANEIYHRSNWGNAVNDIYWADVYEKYSATNKMYIRSDYYENSNVTDKLMADIYPKPSILLTPTAYDNGKLNSVKPVGGENLLLQSNSFNTSWGANYGISSRTSGQTGYDGTNDAWLFEKDANTFTYMFQNVDTSGLQTYSVYAKANTLNSITLYVNGNANNKYAKFDLSDGSAQTANLITSNATDVGNGWYRLSITFDDTLTRVRLYPDFSEGDAGSIFIQDAQLEKGLKANTYIETTTTTKANGDFNFSRNSSATRVNEKGLIEDVQILSGNLVQNGDFSQIGSQLITNGSFDTDSDWLKETGWSIGNGKANAVLANGTQIYQLINFTSGKIYKVVYTISNHSNGAVFVQLSGNGFTNGIERSSNGTYTDYIKASANHTQLRLRGAGTDGGFTGSIDNVSVKEVGQNWTFGTGWSIEDGKVVGNSVSAQFLTQSFTFVSGKKYRATCTVTGTDTLNNNNSFRLPYDGGVSNIAYVTKGVDGVYTHEFVSTGGSTLYVGYIDSGSFTGSIDNVSVIEITDDTDLPRINYTNGEGSLLLENQSTNLITYSEDFSQWSGINSSRASILENQVISPDGSITADRLSDADNSSNYHNLFQYLTFISGNPYVFSFFAKAGTSDYVNFYLDSGHCAFQFSTKTLSGANSSDCTYTEFENGWYLLTFYKSSLSSTSRPISIYTGGGTSDSDGSYIGNPSKNVFIWGAQVEASSYATSYIPTNGSTVTRLADVCNNAGSSDLINSTEGVLYAEISALADDLSQRQISIDDGTGNNRIVLRYNNVSNNINAYLFNGTVQGGEFNYVVNDITEFNKIAFKYKQNNFSLFVNGIEVATDTSGSTFSANTLKDLSFDFNGNFDFYGKTKCVAVFKEALDNDQLERLTGEGYETFKLLAQANNYTII